MRLGVLDGTALADSPEERQQVREYIDRFSAASLAACKVKVAAERSYGPEKIGADDNLWVDMPRPGSASALAGPGALIKIAAGLESMERQHDSESADHAQSTLDTISSLVFAGHDTTANTLSWCCYELARNQEVQRKLQAELDGLESDLLVPKGHRQLEYADLAKLPYLTRVLHETLRLWPIVHYGSLRELQREARVCGMDGKQIVVPAGTQVQLPPFALHHSEMLWGPTASDFDPDRDFADRELYGTDEATGAPYGLRGWNPKSSRFVPFQAAPRQCIGLNYAQMVMRLVLAALLRRYTMHLAGPCADPNQSRRDLSIARPLLKPKHGIWVKLVPRAAAS
eukprot:SAG31_NODE_902_length_11133_cov_4.169386_4_plen_341_part_00